MRPALFARFQALVVPSIWENSPYVYFEGMAAGLLCIGSATGEMKAVAHITGGPSVRPGDMDEWVLALQAATTQSSQDILLAQYAYLRTRRQNTLKRLVAYYAEVAVS
jgi:glycosyltransferase involved in cell wall biosynthesis